MQGPYFTCQLWCLSLLLKLKLPESRPSVFSLKYPQHSPFFLGCPKYIINIFEWIKLWSMYHSNQSPGFSWKTHSISRDLISPIHFILINLSQNHSFLFIKILPSFKFNYFLLGPFSHPLNISLASRITLSHPVLHMERSKIQLRYYLFFA